jgi:hypothetical protein
MLPAREFHELRLERYRWVSRPVRTASNVAARGGHATPWRFLLGLVGLAGVWIDHQ